MKGAGTASSPLLVGPCEEEAGTKPSPPLALRLHELALPFLHLRENFVDNHFNVWENLTYLRRFTYDYQRAASKTEPQ